MVRFGYGLGVDGSSGSDFQFRPFLWVGGGVSFGRGGLFYPQDKVSIWSLLRTPGRFTTRPLAVYFTTMMSVVRPFSVLSKDEIGP